MHSGCIMSAYGDLDGSHGLNALYSLWRVECCLYAYT